MAIPTASRVTWPVAHSGATGPTSSSIVGPDRHRSRHPYSKWDGKVDSKMGNTPRVIVAYDGFSLGQQAPR